MKKSFLKFKKVFTNISITPLILIFNSLELSAKYLPGEIEKSLKTYEINDNYDILFKGFDTKKRKIS